MKYWFLTSIIIVAIIIGAGIWFIGTPGTERLRRADQQRVTDLQSIQYAVINAWTVKQDVPASLADVAAIVYLVVPQDPETKAAYSYTRLSDSSFRVCANFALPSEEGSDYYAKYAPYPTYPIGGGPIVGGERWDHKAGEQCFDRTIDVEYHKRNKLITQ